MVVFPPPPPPKKGRKYAHLEEPGEEHIPRADILLLLTHLPDFPLRWIHNPLDDVGANVDILRLGPVPRVLPKEVREEDERRPERRLRVIAHRSSRRPLESLNSLVHSEIKRVRRSFSWEHRYAPLLPLKLRVERLAHHSHPRRVDERMRDTDAQQDDFGMLRERREVDCEERRFPLGVLCGVSRRRGVPEESDGRAGEDACGG